MRGMKYLICGLGLALGMVASGTAWGEDAPALAPEEQAAGFRLLFDGKSLEGWRPYGRTGAITNGWVVEAGVLKKVAGRKGGDIVSAQPFDDFELRWEWRVAPGGNNGVKYLVTEARPQAPGHEYQMLDDESAKWSKIPAKEKTASFYNVLAPAADKPLKPGGEWNESRIVVRGLQVEHWLNGAKVLAYELESDELKSALAGSKFKKFADFGKKIRGFIMLTDHGDEACYRRIRVKAP